MKSKNNLPTAAGKHANDPRKNDSTKQDERDNDATRIRTDKEKSEKPAMPSDPSGKGAGNRGVEEPEIPQPGKRPGHKPEPVTEPAKQQGSAINKNINPATHNRQDESQERDDSGKPVLKKYGKGL